MEIALKIHLYKQKEQTKSNMQTMKKIIIIMTALLAFGAAGKLSAQTVNDVNIKYNEAVKLYQDKKYAEAIPAFEEVINMGLEVGGEATNTIAAAQKALPEAYFRRALEFAQQQKTDDAFAELNKAMESGELYGVPATVRKARSLSAQLYRNLGAAHFNNKEYEQAIPYFQKGYEIDPSFTENAIFMGDSYAELGKYEEAFNIFNQVVAMGERSSRHKAAADQANEKIFYYMTVQANDVAKSGNARQAYTLFEEILKLDPNNANAHMVRLQAATNAEDWNNVIRWAQAAADAQTSDADKSEIYFLQAAAYQNTERPDQAIATYRKVTAGNKVALAKSQIEILSNPS